MGGKKGRSKETEKEKSKRGLSSLARKKTDIWAFIHKPSDSFSCFSTDLAISRKFKGEHGPKEVFQKEICEFDCLFYLYALGARSICSRLFRITLNMRYPTAGQKLQLTWSILAKRSNDWETLKNPQKREIGKNRGYPEMWGTQEK